jgi:hypothetical protein
MYSAAERQRWGKRYPYDVSFFVRQGKRLRIVFNNGSRVVEVVKESARYTPGRE